MKWFERKIRNRMRDEALGRDENLNLALYSPRTKGSKPVYLKGVARFGETIVCGPCPFVPVSTVRTDMDSDSHGNSSQFQLFLGDQISLIQRVGQNGPTRSWADIRAIAIVPRPIQYNHHWPERVELLLGPENTEGDSRLKCFEEVIGAVQKTMIGCFMRDYSRINPYIIFESSRGEKLILDYLGQSRERRIK
jgi:hypothetical protein